MGWPRRFQKWFHLPLDLQHCLLLTEYKRIRRFTKRTSQILTLPFSTIDSSSESASNHWSLKQGLKQGKIHRQMQQSGRQAQAAPRHPSSCWIYPSAWHLIGNPIAWSGVISSDTFHTRTAGCPPQRCCNYIYWPQRIILRCLWEWDKSCMTFCTWTW